MSTLWFMVAFIAAHATTAEMAYAHRSLLASVTAARVPVSVKKRIGLACLDAANELMEQWSDALLLFKDDGDVGYY